MFESVLLFLGAAVGHAALLASALNILFGFPFDHKLLNRLRLLGGLAILFGPPALVLATGCDWNALAANASRSLAGLLLYSYAVVCAGIGLVVVPIATVRYWWGHRRPAAVLQEKAETLDMTAHLGRRPLGPSPRRWLAKLPGNDSFRVEFTDLTVRLPGWPAAWDGVTLLHLSDLHMCGTYDRAFFTAVVDRAMAAGVPDLLAITGDVVDSKHHHRWIVPVLGRLRWHEAAFAILGNHDFWYDSGKIRRRIERVGIRMLANTWHRQPLRGLPLTVVGHEGPWHRPGPDLSGCPTDGFRLCLSHTPDNIVWAQRHGIGFMLSGHNHGGQGRIPGVGSVFTPSRYGRRYDGGTFAEGTTLLHVNRGLAGRDPIRLFCKPQVTRFVLLSASVSDFEPRTST